MAHEPHHDHHHHDHAPAARPARPQGRAFSFAQQGLALRLVVAALLVLAIWVVIAMLVRA